MQRGAPGAEAREGVSRRASPERGLWTWVAGETPVGKVSAGRGIRRNKGAAARNSRGRPDSGRGTGVPAHTEGKGPKKGRGATLVRGHPGLTRAWALGREPGPPRSFSNSGAPRHPGAAPRGGRQGAHGHAEGSERVWGHSADGQQRRRQPWLLTSLGLQPPKVGTPEDTKICFPQYMYTTYSWLGLGHSPGFSHLQLQDQTAHINLPAFHFRHLLQEAYPLPHPPLPLLRNLTSASTLISSSLFS